MGPSSTYTASLHLVLVMRFPPAAFSPRPRLPSIVIPPSHRRIARVLIGHFTSDASRLFLPSLLLRRVAWHDSPRYLAQPQPLLTRTFSTLASKLLQSQSHYIKLIYPTNMPAALQELASLLELLYPFFLTSREKKMSLYDGPRPRTSRKARKILFPGINEFNVLSKKNLIHSKEACLLLQSKLGTT